MEEYQREPCPYRIVDDSGGAFAMGCLGGGAFHAVKGFRNAPAGLRRRFYGGLMQLKPRSPAVAGQFAVWGGLFSAVDCLLVHYRQREDPWNGIVSGAVAGGVVAARKGMLSMAGSGFMGGMLLAMFEGMGILITRFSADEFRNPDLLSPIEASQLMHESGYQNEKEPRQHEGQQFQ